MSLDTRVSQLIKRIYSAGSDRRAWDNATVEIFRLLGCCGGVATLIDLKRTELLSCRVYAPQGANSHSAVDEYASVYRADPIFRWAVRHPDGRFCDSSRFQQDASSWSSRFGSAHQLAGFARPAGDLIYCLVAHFIANPDSKAVRLFEILFDHFECAMRVGARPFNPDSARALLRLGNDGMIEQVSKGAHRLLRAGSHVGLSGDRLVAIRRAEQSNLDRAFECVVETRAAQGAPTAVQIAGEAGRPWIIIMRPVVEFYGPFGAQHRQVDIELLDHVPVIGRLDVVQSLFDLTGRELQVLGLLAQGHNIDSLSAKIEVSRNTTRAHLRSIFGKTKTSSQAELMQLCGGLSSLATAERDPADLMLVN